MRYSTIRRFVDNVWIKFYGFADQHDCKPHATASIIQWNSKHMKLKLKLGTQLVYAKYIHCACACSGPLVRACVFVNICFRFEQCNILLRYMIPLNAEHVASLAHRISTLTSTHSGWNTHLTRWCGWHGSFLNRIGIYIRFEIFQRCAIIATIVTTVTVRVLLCFRCIFLCNYVSEKSRICVRLISHSYTVLYLPIYLSPSQQIDGVVCVWMAIWMC